MLTKEHIHIMCHSLGLNDRGKGKSHRNYFYTYHYTIDYNLCLELVDLKLMEQENIDSSDK